MNGAYLNSAMVGRSLVGEVLKYEFSQLECVSNLYTDSINTNLIGKFSSVSTPNCLPSNGISVLSNRYISQKNASSLINKLKSSTSITLEFWLQPNLTAVTDSAIFSIGSKTGNNFGNSLCGYNLQVNPYF